MKKTIFLTVLLAASALFAGAQEKKDIIKTGWNIGPLPAIAYDADKGLQLGAIIQLFDYGDGHNYPNYDNKVYAEVSYFTKGSWLIQTMYDAKELIPNVRWTTACIVALDKGMDFFGFNGYGSYYNYERIAAGNDKSSSDIIYTPFYKMKRNSVLFKSDFVGNITDRFKWAVGYHASYFDQGAIDYDNINRGKAEEKKFPQSESTLYEDFVNWGLISADEANGGFVSSIRAGLSYDSRDKEGAPSRGIWAEGHVTLAPKWLGTKNPFARYSLTFRHYVPIVKNDVLTFAYRLNYEGTFGNEAPYYVLPYMTVQGENWDRDGMGGYRTTRGIMRNRAVGLDMFTYNAEFRWRFTKFHIGRQNIALALSAFSDGTTVTRGRDMSYKGGNSISSIARYEEFMANSQQKDSFHITAGAGFRFIMNENFIVAAEYGMPISHLSKNSSVYNQDGTGAFYLNVGYLF